MESTTPYLICFGDSLTAGYQAEPEGLGPNVDTPPGSFIQQWVGTRAYIEVTGICGEVTGEMVKRFHRDVIVRRPKFVVILGGTNDLGWGVAPDEICANLQTMYGLALEASIHPVGVTVPSICIDDADPNGGSSGDNRSFRVMPDWALAHISQRLVLNRKIEEACQALHITCLDLFTLTAKGPDHRLASQLSSDGLHLNTPGYETFGRLIWENLLAETFNGGHSTV